MIMLNGVGITTLKNAAVVKQALVDTNSTVNKGVYDATLLETVDADLAAANIVTGKTIFGKVGAAAAGTATHDIEADTVAAGVSNTGTQAVYNYLATLAASAELDLATLTQAYTAGSLAEAYGFVLARAVSENTIKLRLYMDGVQVGETAYVGYTENYFLVTVNGYKALSGSKIVKIALHNYGAGDRDLRICGTTVSSGCPYVAGVFSGSVKVV